MKYHEIAPSPLLRKHVDACWIFENKTHKPCTMRILPDGCSDIVIPASASHGEILVIGCMTRSKMVTIAPWQHLFGIRFKPGLAVSFLKTRMSELTDRSVPLPSVRTDPFKHLPGSISQYSPEEIAQSVETVLATSCTNTPPDPEMLHVIQKITASGGRASIGTISCEVGWSKRHMERKFQEEVGLTPKNFSRIVRFQNARKYILEEGLANLAGIAMRAGYYDQAHFCREHKRLADVSPAHEEMSPFYNTWLRDQDTM